METQPLFLNLISSIPLCPLVTNSPDHTLTAPSFQYIQFVTSYYTFLSLHLTIFCLFCFVILFYICIFCVFLLFCILDLLLYVAASLLFLYNSTDRCHRVEIPLQQINVSFHVMSSHHRLEQIKVQKIKNIPHKRVTIYFNLTLFGPCITV